MGNDLSANKPKHKGKHARPPTRPDPYKPASNRKGSKVFFPPDEAEIYRQESTQSSEEANFLINEPEQTHPGEIRRQTSLKPSAPTQTIPYRANPTQLLPPDSDLLISELRELPKFKKRFISDIPGSPLSELTAHLGVDRVFTPIQTHESRMEAPNQTAIEDQINQLIGSVEEERMATEIKQQVAVLFQSLRRLELDNAALRRTVGGRPPGPDPAGDIAALQEEIANYQGQIKGLEDKNNELYKVNHEWSEEYKNIRKSMTDQIKHLEGEKNALERQIAKLDGDLTENDQATDQLIKKLKSSNLMLTQDKQILEQHNEDLDSEKSKLAKRLTTLEKLYEEDVNEELAAKEQIRDLAVTIREMKDKEKKHINEYRLIDDRVTELQDQLRKVKNQLKNEKDKKENVEKELKKANRAFKEIKKDIFEQLSKDHYSPPIASKERKKGPKYPPRYAFGPSELAAEKKLSKRLATLAPWDEDFSVLEECIPSKDGYNFSETSEDEFY